MFPPNLRLERMFSSGKPVASPLRLRLLSQLPMGHLRSCSAGSHEEFHGSPGAWHPEKRPCNMISAGMISLLAFQGGSLVPAYAAANGNGATDMALAYE
jgi:hypothetical protein